MASDQGMASATATYAELIHRLEPISKTPGWIIQSILSAADLKSRSDYPQKMLDMLNKWSFAPQPKKGKIG